MPGSVGRRWSRWTAGVLSLAMLSIVGIDQGDPANAEVTLTSVCPVVGLGTLVAGDPGGGTATETTLSAPHGLAVAGDGTMYVSERNWDVNTYAANGQGRIRRISPAGGIDDVVLGPPGLRLGALALNLAATVLYVATTDGSNVHRVHALDLTADPPVWTHVAGGGGAPMDNGVPATSAQFGGIDDVGVSPTTGLLYVSGFAQDPVPVPEDPRPLANVGVVREVDASGDIRTVAGGVRNTSSSVIEGIIATSSFLHTGPVTIEFGPGGAMTVSSLRRIRQLTPAATSNPYGDGTITTIAGANNTASMTGDGGTAAAARLGDVTAMAVGADGTIYLSAAEGHAVRRIDTLGSISTIVSETGSPTSDAGVIGFADGAGDTARVAWVTSLATHGGDLFVVDSRNNRVREVVPGATAALTVVSTRAGRGPNDVDTTGPALSRQTGLLDGIAAAPDGSIYLADRGAYRVWRRDVDGSMAAVAGTGAYRPLDGPLATGPATATPLGILRDVDVSADGQTLYILERTRVLAVDIGSGVLTLLAGTGAIGETDDPVGTSATLNTGAQGALAVGGGFIYATGASGNIRRVSLATGAVDTPISELVTPGVAGIPSVEASSDGSLFIATSTHRIFYWSGSGAPTVIAGDGVFGNAGDGGRALDARVGGPQGLSLLDRPGDADVLYLSNGGNPIRAISAAGPTGAERWSDGTIRRVAGGLSESPFGPGNWGDGRDISTDPTVVRLNRVKSTDVGPDGRLYLVDVNYSDANPLAPMATNTGPHAVRVLTDAGCSDARLSGPGSVAPGASGGVDLTSLPVGQIPFDLDAVAATPLRAVPLRAVGERASPLRAVPLRAVPLRAVGIGSSPLRAVTLNTIVLDAARYPGGWPARLVGTPYENVPPQAVRLADLLDDPSTASDETSPALTATPEITLDSTDLSTSPLRAVSIASIALGSTPLRAVPLNETFIGATDEQRFTAWCALLAGLGQTCDGISPESPLLALEVRSVPLRAVPLRAVPLRAVDITSTPLRAVPLRAVGLEPSSLRNSPLRAVPLRAVAEASAPLRAVPLRAVDLATSPLRAVVSSDLGGAAASVVTCAVGQPDCTTLGDAFDSGALNPTATLGALIPALLPRPDGSVPTLGDLRWRDPLLPDAFFGAPGATQEVSLGDILLTEDHPAALPAAPFISLADLLLGLVATPDLPWEDVDLDAAGIAAAGSSTPAELSLTARVYPGQPGPIPVTVTLPPGWRHSSTEAVTAVPDASASAVTVGPVAPPLTSIDTASGRQSLVYSLPSGMPTPATVTVDISATVGFRLGATTATATVGPVIPGGATSAPIESDTINVVDENEFAGGTGGSYEQARLVLPDRLYPGYLNAPGDTDYFRVEAPGAGTLTTIHLSHLPADADLVVYEESNSQFNLRSNVARLRQQAKPLQMVNPQVGVSGEPLEAQLLNDVIVLPDKTLAATSARSGTANEMVELINDGDDDTATADDDVSYVIAVTSYDDAASDEPYILRVQQRVPAGATACAATGPGAVQLPPVPEGFTPSAPPAPLPAATQTLLLVNRERLAREFGIAATTNLTQRLESFAARPDVRGAIIAVDGDPATATAYDTWDASPCGLGRPNLVVRAINDRVDALLSASPGIDIQNLVVVGSDEQIPMARILDNTKLSNEIEYGAELRRAGGGSTPQTVALASKSVMSDDPYASNRPVLFGPDVIYPPTWAIGRLVESPVEITASLDAYDDAAGRLDADSALVTGYDFLSDGALAVADSLRGNVTVDDDLVNDTWSAEELGDRLIEAPTAPDISSLNAHFDHHQLLPAAGEADPESPLFTTADLLAAPNRLEGRVLFSMGCHSGTSAPDFYLGVSGDAALDWPQAFAQLRSVWVANSGYGYGDTAAVAYSEKLMARFSALINSGERAGEALRLAKQQYLSEGLSNSYDAKVLGQAIYYGLPMFRVGLGTPAPETPTFVPTTPDPAAGGVPSSTRTVTPDLRLSAPQDDGSRHVYAYDASETVEALRAKTHVADGRPIQPRVDVDVTAAGLEARGSIVTALTMTDQPLRVSVGRPVVDLGSNEPPSLPVDSVYPSAFSNVTAFENRAGQRDRLVLVPGQWLAPSTGDPAVGLQRSFTSVTSTVYYATPGDSDDIQPQILSTSGSASSSGVAFKATVTDRTPIGSGQVRRIVVLYLDGTTWRSTDLTELTPGSGNFVGGGPAESAEIQYLVQAVDASGNVGMASDKARLFDASSAPVGGGGVNGAPVVQAGADRSAAWGADLPLVATFSDPDTSSTWSAVVNNGAGSATPMTVAAGAVSSTLPPYETPGVYTVTVTVCDEEGSCGVDTLLVTVDQSGIVPTATCTILSFGQFITWWGVSNSTGATVAVPLGPLNRFEPPPPTRGQPTSIAAGSTPHAFATLGSAASRQRWLLGGSSAASMTARGCAP